MTKRLFVALWPPTEVVAALAPLAADVAARVAADTERLELPGSSAPRLRWQVPSRWHITLAFLGQREIDPTIRRLDRLAVPAIGPVSLLGAGTFGPILWSGVKHGPALSAAARMIQVGLDARDARFQAHMTLARERGSGQSRTRAGGLARMAAGALAEHSGPQWTPTDVSLVVSVSGQSASYEVVHRLPLPIT